MSALPKFSQVPLVLDAETRQPSPHAMGGGLEGAERTSRELFSWNPGIISPDQQINDVKEMADARGRDSVQNDGYILGATNIHKDSIVGSQYMLNAQPDYELLGFDEAWAEEFQRVVEARFNLAADAEDSWFDAQRVNTLTGLLRLAVGGFVFTGEVLATVEWIKEAARPFYTAIQMVSPTRLSNPNWEPDSKTLKRGVEKDFRGAPVAYHIRQSYPSEFFDFDVATWKRVPVRKPWGRIQVIHIIEQLQPDQTRGIADMVSALKQMRMTKKFQDVTLQNAVVNASYAAAIESELPTDAVFQSMGAAGVANGGLQGYLGQYMTALTQYVGASNNIQVDGVKMPHLFPGTKLSLKPMGTPGGVGTGFEESLMRHISAALGLSYEQFSRDYTKTNYSSARASMAETWKYMQSRKKMVADRMASIIYTLWMEEELNDGNLPIPRGMTRESFRDMFYTDAIKRLALTRCSWIGASRGQIDEMKETQAAMLRINGGLSTYEAESARLGMDYRRTFQQRAREERLKKELGLEFSTDATKPTTQAENSQVTKDPKDNEEE